MGFGIPCAREPVSWGNQTKKRRGWRRRDANAEKLKDDVSQASRRLGSNVGTEGGEEKRPNWSSERATDGRWGGSCT